VAHALEAADRAERAAAQEEVARFLRIALDLLADPDPRRTRLLARLALALAWSFDGERAVEVGLEAADRIAAAEGADAAADYLCELSRVVTPYAFGLAWRLAERGLHWIGDRRDLVWCRLAVQDQRRREAEDPDHPGLPLDTPLRREITRVVSRSGVGGLALRRMVLDENLAFESRDEASALRTPSVLFGLVGDLRGALALYEENLAHLLARGQLGRACHDLTAMTAIHSGLGDLEAAERCLGQAARLMSRVSEGSTLYFNLVAARAGLAIARGDDLQALLAAGEAMLRRAAPDQAFGRAGVHAALMRGYAESGRTREAIEHLGCVVAAIERAPGWANLVLTSLDSTIEALWLLGRTDSIDVLERNLRRKALAPDFRNGGTDARLSLARLCALDRRFDEASAWFARARALLDERGARPARAIADYDEALMLTRRNAPGDAERAVPLAERALAQFRAIGMTGWERRARELLAARSSARP
jgi:tetratricopeptide (TPR) repeat protein